MPSNLPIRPEIQLLPFWDPRFGYGDFEGFFTDFLRLHPVIEVTRNHETYKGRVISASRYQTSGDAQNGIDIRAEVEVTCGDGSSQVEVWAFQCKHRKTWSPEQTRKAVQLANDKFKADFYFLLVTCKLTAAVVEEGAAQPNWQIWGDELISSHLRALPSRDEAARVVYTYFGTGWPESILGISAEGPLLSPGGYFAPLMDAYRFHHHKAQMIGRESELQSMHQFLDDPICRVLILPGAGGRGKSRLLKDFSQSLSPAQRRKHSVRFYSQIGILPTRADLDAIEGLPVIVIDDAHRTPIEPLLRLFLRKQGAKVILASRPQGIPVVRSSTASAEVDARFICELSPLAKLSDHDTLRVVESLLGQSHREWFTHVVKNTQGCLLIAVVACEMIRQGKLTKSHLASHQEFEQAVFTRLIDEGCAKLGLITQRDRIDRILEIIALAGPIPREGPWFDILAAEADAHTKPHQVRGCLDALKLSGLLIENREGYRITPDVLSDHLLYRAIFDSDLRNKGFVDDFLLKIPEPARDEGLTRCLPNLAEAEWRAHCESTGRHQSVIDRHLESWLCAFRLGSFRRRREMLSHWGHFAVYLPKQTIQIAKLALELTTTGTPNEEGFLGLSQDKYAQVVDAVLPLLKTIARYHHEHMHTCFDLLWGIGADEPKQWMHNNQFHPLSAIIEVAKLEYHKPLSVNAHALKWLEIHFLQPKTITKLHRPVWWFSALLSPFLEHTVDDNQYERGSGVFSWSAVPISINRVSELRSSVLKLVMNLATRGHEGIAVNAINVLRQGFRMPNFLGLEDDSQLQKQWMPQRTEALSCLAKVVSQYNSGYIHWAIWSALWWHISCEPANQFRAECWKVFRLLRDTFELRLVRAICSSGDSEVTPLIIEEKPVPKGESRWEISQTLWTQLCQNVANELALSYSEANHLHTYLADTVARGAALDYSPGLGTVLNPLASLSPSLGESLAREIIASPRVETKHAFGSLLDGLCPPNQPIRLDLVKCAVDSSDETLKDEAARLLVWWQRQKRLPPEGAAMLFQLTATASSGLLRSILRQASFLPTEDDAFISPLLLNVLKNPTSEEITEPLLAMLSRLERDKVSILPCNLVSSLLNRLVPIPKIEDPMELHYLGQLAETHPVEMFHFYLQRVYFSLTQNSDLLFNESSYQAIPRGGDRVSLRSFATLPDFELEFGKLRSEIILRASQTELSEAEPLIQLMRAMLNDSGKKYETLVSDWIPPIKSVTDLWLFLDVVVGRSPKLVLGHPPTLEALLKHIATDLPDSAEKAKADLMFSASRWVGASRNPQWKRLNDTNPSEEEEPWNVIPRVERLILENQHYPMLKAFYEELLSKCRVVLAYHKKAQLEYLNNEDDI